MKMKISMLLIVVLFVLGSTLFSNYSVISAKQKAANGHLIWDKLDGVWRCLGTPVMCRRS